MKKNNCVFILILFCLFVTKVNALSYDIEIDTVNSSKTDKSLYELNVSLKNVSDTEEGVSTCLMGIELSDKVKLNPNIRTVNGWSMTEGNIYLFDTGQPILNEGKFMVIPIKITGNGTVTLKDVECSDGVKKVSIEDKVVKLTYVSNSSSSKKEESSSSKPGNSSTNVNKNPGVSDKEEIKDSNCNLENIILSEGSIDFDPNITEYDITIKNYEKLEVIPELSSENASYVVVKEENRVVIDVTAENGDQKQYIIYVSVEDDSVSGKKSNVYTPIFIGIIVVLILINVIRIISNLKKKS